MQGAKTRERGKGRETEGEGGLGGAEDSSRREGGRICLVVCCCCAAENRIGDGDGVGGFGVSAGTDSLTLPGVAVDARAANAQTNRSRRT